MQRLLRHNSSQATDLKQTLHQSLNEKFKPGFMINEELKKASLREISSSFLPVVGLKVLKWIQKFLAKLIGIVSVSTLA